MQCRRRPLIPPSDDSNYPSDNAVNYWRQKTVEQEPDGSTTTTYRNSLGETLLTDIAQGSSHVVTYYQYNSDGRLTLEAEPSAVLATYDDSCPDLGFKLHESRLLNDTGLIHCYSYATESSPTLSDTQPETLPAICRKSG